MSRKNRFSPTSGICTPELKAKAKEIWLSWNEALVKHTKRKGIPVPLRYDRDVPVPVDAAFHSICGWVANNEDWKEQWTGVLERLGVSGHWLRYGNGFKPTLAWLFQDKGNDKQRPIEKVLEGIYDTQVNTYADENTANDNRGGTENQYRKRSQPGLTPSVGGYLDPNNFINGDIHGTMKPELLAKEEAIEKKWNKRK